MIDPLHDMPEGAKIAEDVASSATLLGSLASLLPAVAGSGGGTYTLGGGSPALDIVPEPLTGFDIAGTARSGVQNAGAYA